MRGQSKFAQRGFIGIGPALLTPEPVGGGGGSYFLRDQMNGGSRDTALFSATTRAAPWVSGSTQGGGDVQSGGSAIITPTASGLFFEGRSTAADNISVASRETWLHIPSVSTVRHKTMFGYCHRTNRSAMNFRFELEVAFGAFVLAAFWNNFGGGTAWDNNYGSAGSVPPWWGWVDEGTDLAFYVATNSGGAPGTRTLVRRLSLTSGGDGYFSPNDGDVSVLVDNYNSEASAINESIGEIYITA